MDKTAKAKDLLDNIIQRLEKIEKRQEDQIRKQSQTDEVLERLDTIHNRLERQNQKQNALDGKFSDVSYQLEQEKGFMRDQLQAAQNEILRRLTELQTKGEELAQTHGSSGRRAEPSGYEGTKEHELDTALDKVADEVGRSVQGIKNELEHLKKYFKYSFDETQQHLGREILRSTGIASKQLHKSINDFKENTKAQLSAQTAGMCDKLDNIEVLRQIMSTCEKKLTSIERTTEQHVKQGVVFVVNEFRSPPVAFFEKVFTKETLVYLVLLSAVGLAFWFSRCEDIISVTQKSKRDIIDFIEKENQLVRDRIAGPLPQRKTYISDFYVENFQQLVRSGRVVTSLPWHINQFDTSVRGYVRFHYNGEMEVWLMMGRNPREVGLQPKLYGRFQFNATITDISGGLPDLLVGEKTMTINEDDIKNNEYWGRKAGVVSCDELINKGYGEKELYLYAALLIRYEITIRQDLTG